MQAWILRGQASGRFWQKVFVGYPTDDDFKDALAKELEDHAIQFRHAHDADGKYVLSHSEPRPLWVRAEPIELVLLPGMVAPPEPTEEERAARRFEMRGALDEKGVLTLLERARRGPAGGSGADMTASGNAPPVMQGIGMVINPGEPGHPDNAETQTLTAADVGDMTALLATPPAPAK